MTPPLFLVDALPEGDELHLGGDEGRHAARVKRLTAGEDVLVGDGRGGVLDCTVRAVVADGLLLAVRARRAVPPPRPRITVVQALPKGERAELAVELLTELGVDEIVPWQAARCVVQWQGVRAAKAHAKWQRTAREAGKQSRRAWLPAVPPVASTADVAARLTGGCALVLHEQAAVSLASVDLAPADEVILVVGPEGGVTPEELERFAQLGATAVRLGGEVLRTSTAGAAAVAALSVRLGRWA